jgi:secondary thiamine-phosphate synthase enzyme
MIIKDYTLKVQGKGVCDVIDITKEINQKVAESGIKAGHVLVSVVGSTAGITTVEFEPGLVRDMEDLFDKLAPPTRDYHHEQTWHDGNGFSHVRASLLGPSLVFPLQQGRVRLGTWQQIVLIDFDNRPRNREVAVQVSGLES